MLFFMYVLRLCMEYMHEKKHALISKRFRYMKEEEKKQQFKDKSYKNLTSKKECNFFIKIKLFTIYLNKTFLKI